MPRLRCVNAPATASVFVQLSMRRHAASGGLTILDLLLPASFRPTRSLSLRPYHHVSTRRVVDGYRQIPVFAAQSSRPPWNIATSRGGELSKSRIAPLNLSCHTFSTSFTRRATHALFNPQVDDEGNEMMLEITPRAAKRLSEIMAKDSNPNLALRIQVESGGCHGFQYLMKLVTLPPSLPSKESLPPAAEEDASAAIREDDTIFTYVPDDNSSPGDLTAPKIILDFPSLELLKGSKVDFTMELIGSQFKIVDNPLATSSCGCGTSFDIKI